MGEVMGDAGVEGTCVGNVSILLLYELRSLLNPALSCERNGLAFLLSNLSDLWTVGGS